jgi:hypothetical protein
MAADKDAVILVAGDVPLFSGFFGYSEDLEKLALSEGLVSSFRAFFRVSERCKVFLGRRIELQHLKNIVGPVTGRGLELGRVLIHRVLLLAAGTDAFVWDFPAAVGTAEDMLEVVVNDAVGPQ